MFDFDEVMKQPSVLRGQVDWVISLIVLAAIVNAFVQHQAASIFLLFIAWECYRLRVRVMKALKEES